MEWGTKFIYEEFMIMFEEGVLEFLR